MHRILSLFSNVFKGLFIIISILLPFIIGISIVNANCTLEDTSNNLIIAEAFKELTDPNYNRRWGAVQTILSNINKPSVLNTLRECLNSPDTSERIVATYTLFLAGDDPEIRFNEMLHYLELDSPEEQGLTEFILIKWFDCIIYDKYIDDIIMFAQRTNNPSAEHWAVFILHNALSNSEVFDYVISLTTNQSADIRKLVTEMLEWKNGESSVIRGDDTILETLMNLLKDDSEKVRVAACRSIASHGYFDMSYYALLDVYQYDRSPDVRRSSLIGLAQIGPREITGPIVLDALQSRNRSFRVDATAAVKYVGAYPGIAKAISDIIDEAPPRWGSFLVATPYSQLQYLGSEACEVLPTLISVIRQRRVDSDMAIEALQYIYSSCPDSVNEILLEVLVCDNDYYDLEAALIVVGKIRGINVLHINEITRLAQCSQFMERLPGFPLSYFAVDALGNQKEFADITIPFLENLLQDNSGSAFAVHINLALYKLG